MPEIAVDMPSPRMPRPMDDMFGRTQSASVVLWIAVNTAVTLMAAAML